MAEVLKRILGPVNIASGNSVLFTGVVSHTYLFRKIKIVNPTAAVITLKLGIGGIADANLIMPTTSIDAGGWGEGDDFIVLTGVETLNANASATGLTITINGLDQI